MPLKSCSVPCSVGIVGYISNQRHSEKGEKKGLKTRLKN